MLSDFFRLQVDLVGARTELAAGMLSDWLLNRVTPAADGHRPVITLPGFLASDATLVRLNGYLNRHGFAAESWGFGRNLGPQDKSWSAHLDHIEEVLGGRIRELADQHAAPVALIGQSLGGVYAREMALKMEQDVDRVITLGSPTFHPYLTHHHNRVVSLFSYWLSRQSQTELAGRSGLLHWDADHPAMPCVAIHSPIDGVVPEASAVIPSYIVSQSSGVAPRENLRVLSTHIGMSVNPWVLLAIADRLCEDRNAWQSFDPYQYFPRSLHWAVAILFPPEEEPAEQADIVALAEGG